MITEQSDQTRAEAYDAALDRLVDTRNISYDDARRELGKSPYEIYEVPAPIAVAVVRRALKTSAVRRRRNGHGPQYGEEEGVGYLNGEPHYFQPHAPLSDEQVARNAQNAAALREKLARGGATEVSDDPISSR